MKENRKRQPEAGGVQERQRERLNGKHKAKGTNTIDGEKKKHINSQEKYSNGFI